MLVHRLKTYAQLWERANDAVDSRLFSTPKASPSGGACCHVAREMRAKLNKFADYAG
jgi:hypothetical protein